MPEGSPPPTAGNELLVTISGRDRPGLTARIFDELRGDVLDVEQTVVQDRLVQMVLLASARGAAAVRADLSALAAELDLDIEVRAAAHEPTGRRQQRQRLVLLASPLPPAAVADVARAVRDCGGNIERVTRMAAYPVTAIEVTAVGASLPQLRRSAVRVARRTGVDISVQPLGLDRFGRRLVVLDVDSTLIRQEVIELLAAHTGTQEQVAEITERAMGGHLDFADSLVARAALLAGAPESVLDDVRDEIKLTPGARTLCRTLTGLGHDVALVSGGFTAVIAPLAAQLGVSRVRANTLEVVNGRLTGRVVPPIVDRQGKAAALRAFAAELGVPMSRTVAIGDGANDLDMLATAGLGVAFNAKPVLREAADAAVNVPFLDSILFLMGMSREEIEEAGETADGPG